MENNNNMDNNYNREIMNIYSKKYVMNNEIDLFCDTINKMIKNTYNNYNNELKEHFSHLIIYENREWEWSNLEDLS